MKSESEYVAPITKNNNYMAEHYKELQEKHGGKVVAVSNGKFLYSAEFTKKLLQRLKTDKVDLSTVLVEYVPEPGVVILF
jgi:hypothetical protein